MRCPICRGALPTEHDSPGTGWNEDCDNCVKHWRTYMREVKQKMYDVTITEIRTYVVQGDGTSKFEAEQDAIARFHRLNKSGELICDSITRPKVVDVRLS